MATTNALCLIQTLQMGHIRNLTKSFYCDYVDARYSHLENVLHQLIQDINNAMAINTNEQVKPLEDLQTKVRFDLHLIDEIKGRYKRLFYENVDRIYEKVVGELQQEINYFQVN